MSMIVVVAAAVGLLLVQAAWAADLYVAPDGNDKAAGTKAQPLATLAGARDAVRKLRKDGGKGNVTVWFAGGTYRLRETVVFGLADSAPEGATTAYAAVPGSRPLFSAGVPVTGWQKLAANLETLPAKARGKVYVADLPEGVEKVGTLFQGQNWLPRARCAGFVPSPDAKEDTWNDQEQRTLRFPPGAMKKWANLADVEISVVGAAPWTMNVLPLESVDVAAGVARVAVRSTYRLGRPRFGHFQAGSVFVENVLEGLDEPGKWAVDSRSRKVYWWPTKDSARSERDWGVVAPVLTELVRVEGRINYDAPADEPVRGIEFRGLSFLHGERFTWRADHAGWGVQHDWEMFDAPSAVVRFRGAQRCGLRACRVAAAGGTGVRMDLHCQGNYVEDSVIEHVGGAGVFLCGYGLGTKDVNRDNRVVNNHIHDVGKTYWHSSAVFAWQSGSNRIAHNHIHNTPYTAIVASGRIIMDRSGQAECSASVRWKEVDAALAGKPHTWKNREPLMHSRNNVIEYNDIHDVMETIEDGNCVYISGCGGGNLVRYNWLHNCESIHMAEGIRCDDDQHETTVHGNVLWRIGGLATYIAIKGVNHVTNNIMACPATATFRGMLSLECTPVAGAKVQRNIFYATHAKDITCYQGQTYYRNYTRLADCQADFNVYHNTADGAWAFKHLHRERGLGVELHSLAADPLFENAEAGDLRLRKDSPAWKLGFEPIDLGKMGVHGKVGPGACDPK